MNLLVNERVNMKNHHPKGEWSQIHFSRLSFQLIGKLLTHNFHYTQACIIGRIVLSSSRRFFWILLIFTPFRSAFSEENFRLWASSLACWNNLNRKAIKKKELFPNVYDKLEKRRFDPLNDWFFSIVNHIYYNTTFLNSK